MTHQADQLDSFVKFVLAQCVFTTQHNRLQLANTALHFDQYEIMLDNVTESNFTMQRKKKGSCFLFHGSGIENWYSIMANGIKNCSGTSLMTSGAAYGPGIYLSNALGFSMGYGISREFDKAVVGVYEVIGKSSDYHKSGQIFVVPDASLLHLKYLLVFDAYTTAHMQPISDMLYSKFIQNAHNEQLMAEKKLNKRAIRIEKERSLCSKSGYSIDSVTYEEYDCIIWRISFITESSDIGMIQILFTKDYPSVGPIIWDRFGCRKIKKWTVVNRVEALLEGLMPMKNMGDKTPKEFFDAVPKVKRGDLH